MQTTIEPFERVLRPGTVEVYEGRQASVFLKIEYRENGTKQLPGGLEAPKPYELSITGVVGPKRNGHALGSCGQIGLRQPFTSYAEGWDAATVEKLAEVWDAWHLNGMRAGCQHQRASWDASEKLEVVTYKLTSEAWKERRELEKHVQDEAAAAGRVELSDDAQALLNLPLSRKDAPDADSFASGMYEVDKRETKGAGWVYPTEHPGGLLMKPCEACGYKYGSAWLSEEVPQDVLDFLQALPETDQTPAWV